MEPVSDPAHPRPFRRLDYGQMLQGVLGAFAEPRLDADPTGEHTKRSETVGAGMNTAGRPTFSTRG